MKRILVLFFVLGFFVSRSNSQTKNPTLIEKRIESLASTLGTDQTKAREVFNAMNLNAAEIQIVFRDSSLNEQERQTQLIKLFTQRRDKVHSMLTEEQQKKLDKLLDPEVQVHRLPGEARLEAQRKRFKAKMKAKADGKPVSK